MAYRMQSDIYPLSMGRLTNRQGSFALGNRGIATTGGRSASAAPQSQPGSSGNPGGRPRAACSIQELARKHTIEALDVLVQIMLNEKAPPNARVAAANTLLDRAYGKAPTFSTSDTQAFKRAIDMTDDELAAIASRAKLTVV